MRAVAALLATALVATSLVACGAALNRALLSEATLVLDFRPTPSTPGIYTALQEGLYHRTGRRPQRPAAIRVDRCTEAAGGGRAQFAILDIHDLAIARERGFDLVGVMPIVERPLASVIAGDPSAVKTARVTSRARRSGVTGLPSDDAVLDSVVSADGGGPERRSTASRSASTPCASLAAGRIDAATAFWNAEGVTLQRQGVPDPGLPGRRLTAPRATRSSSW